MMIGRGSNSKKDRLVVEEAGESTGGTDAASARSYGKKPTQSVRSPRIDADLAYHAIQAQLNAGFDDDDDYDDGEGGESIKRGDMSGSQQEEDDDEYDMETTMGGSSTPFKTFKSPLLKTASSIKTPGSSFTLPSSFRYSPVQTPAGPPRSAARTPKASSTIFTPGTTASQTPFAPRMEEEEKSSIPNAKEQELIVFDPNKKARVGSYKNQAFADDEAYYNAFQTYLECKRSIKQRYDIWKEKANGDGPSLAMEVVGEETDSQLEEKKLIQEMRDTEILLLQQMTNICFDRENNRIKDSFGGVNRSRDSRSETAKVNNYREYDTWALMADVLENHGVEGLLLENEFYATSTDGISSSNLPAVWRMAPPNFFQKELFPAQMVHKALTFPVDLTKLSSSGRPSLFDWTLFLLQRRYTILRWLEHIYSVHLPTDISSTLPPKDQNTMWKHTLSSMEDSARMGKQHKLKLLTIDTPYHMLNPQDTKEDADLLRGVLMYIHSGQLPEAEELCIDAGQPWRAATLSGGMYHGLQRIRSSENDEARGEDNDNPMEEEEKKKEDSEEVMVEVGNPQRREWKRQCQFMAQSLEKVMQRSTREGAIASNMTPAVIYEAALYAILARDVPRAVSNPFMRNWVSTLWMCMNALVDGTCDSVLEKQALMRAEEGKRFPYPGTTEVFGDSSLNDYSDIVHTLKSEEVILETMGTSAYENVKDEATSDLYRLCTSAVLIGKKSIVECIVDCVAPKCEGLTNNVHDLSPTTLRFAAHFVLFLYCSYFDHLSDGTTDSNIGIYDRASSHHLEGKMMVIIQRYIESLIGQRHLSLVALYTSLLPLDALIETYVKLLLVIDDEDERLLTLNQARENFDTNVDLMILRQVVYSSLFEENENSSAGGRVGEDDRLILVLLNERQVSQGGKDVDAPTVSIWESDVKKIRSIRWLCFYAEHRLDAVVFANALLRQLLLSAFDQGTNNSTRADKTLRSLLGEKINACKVFVANFFPLPPDSESVLQESIDRAVELGAMSRDDIQRLESNCHAALHEHTALIAFLEAHTAFEDWTQRISLCRTSQPANPVHPASVSEEEWKSIEAEMAQKNELRRYKRTMAELARTVLHSTFAAEEKISAVMTFHGVLMEPNGRPGAMDTSSSSPSEWRTCERTNEMKALQSLLLPEVVFMMLAVLDGTASWARTFSSEAASSLQDIGELLVDFEDKTCLDPVYWQRRVMKMADFVSSDDFGLAQHMSGDDLKTFLTLMADGASALSRLLDH